MVKAGVIGEPTRHAAEAGAFRAQTADILLELRSTLLELFSSFPGRVQRSRDLQDHYGIDTKLSWQLFRIISSRDPLECATNIPNAIGVTKAINAAQRMGASDHAGFAVQSAFGRFERHVELHAGDRITFDAMLRGLPAAPAGAPTNEITAAARKPIFESMRQIFGAQVDIHARAILVHPSERVGEHGKRLFDFAVVQSKAGVKRLRLDAAVSLYGFKMEPPKWGGDRHDRESLDPEAEARFGVPILAEFSSPDLPPLKMSVRDDGITDVRLAGDTIGNLGSTHISFGNVSRGGELSRYGPDKRLGVGAMTNVVLPTAMFIADVLVHRPTFGDLNPHFSVFAHCSDFSRYPTESTHVKLPFEERFSFLGRGVKSAQTPLLRHYGDMLATTCNRLKWNAADFDLYRLHLEYPLMDTAMICTLSLPDSHPLAAN